MSTIVSLRPGGRVPDFALPGLDGQLRKFVWSFNGEPVALLAVDDLAHINAAQYAALVAAGTAASTALASWSRATPWRPPRPGGRRSAAA